MSTTNATIGFGASFGIWDGATYVDVAEIVGINQGQRSRPPHDATHLQSPDGYREFIPGIVAGGEVSLTFNYLPANEVALLAAFEAGAGQFQITAPDGQMMRFWAVSTLFEPGALEIDEKRTGSASLTISGKPTIHAAAAPTNVVLPAISGTVQEGETLTAYPGVWTGSPSFAFVWQEEIATVWTAISGATSATLTVPGGSTVGRPLRVVVTGTNSAGSAAANSAETTDVIGA